MGVFDKVFGKLFEKKKCSICKNEIGLLGNRKLRDGNLCKECEAKLSPWFYERKNSTVSEIKKQLTYRKKNYEILKELKITSEYGGRYTVCIDDEQKKFFVAKTKNYIEENCDVIDFSQVKRVEFKMLENISEEYRTDEEGKRQSYEPNAYIYSYNAHITITIENPYFDVISFNLSPSDITLNPDNPLPKIYKPNPMSNPEYVAYKNMGNKLRATLLGGEYVEEMLEESNGNMWNMNITQQGMNTGWGTNDAWGNQNAGWGTQQNTNDAWGNQNAGWGTQQNTNDAWGNETGWGNSNNNGNDGW